MLKSPVQELEDECNQITTECEELKRLIAVEVEARVAKLVQLSTIDQSKQIQSRERAEAAQLNLRLYRENPGYFGSVRRTDLLRRQLENLNQRNEKLADEIDEREHYLESHVTTNLSASAEKKPLPRQFPETRGPVPVNHSTLSFIELFDSDSLNHFYEFFDDQCEVAVEDLNGRNMDYAVKLLESLELVIGRISQIKLVNPEISRAHTLHKFGLLVSILNIKDGNRKGPGLYIGEELYRQLLPAFNRESYLAFCETSQEKQNNFFDKVFIECSTSLKRFVGSHLLINPEDMNSSGAVVAMVGQLIETFRDSICSDSDEREYISLLLSYVRKNGDNLQAMFLQKELSAEKLKGHLSEADLCMHQLQNRNSTLKKEIEAKKQAIELQSLKIVKTAHAITQLSAELNSKPQFPERDHWQELADKLALCDRDTVEDAWLIVTVMFKLIGHRLKTDDNAQILDEYLRLCSLRADLFTNLQLITRLSQLVTWDFIDTIPEDGSSGTEQFRKSLLYSVAAMTSSPRYQYDSSKKGQSDIVQRVNYQRRVVEFFLIHFKNHPSMTSLRENKLKNLISLYLTPDHFSNNPVKKTTLFCWREKCGGLTELEMRDVTHSGISLDSINAVYRECENVMLRSTPEKIKDTLEELFSKVLSLKYSAGLNEIEMIDKISILSSYLYQYDKSHQDAKGEALFQYFAPCLSDRQAESFAKISDVDKRHAFAEKLMSLSIAYMKRFVGDNCFFTQEDYKNPYSMLEYVLSCYLDKRVLTPNKSSLLTAIKTCLSDHKKSANFSVKFL